ncbi:Tigger transposable element-derived protein 6, partial [Trichinella nelsoni]
MLKPLVIDKAKNPRCFKNVCTFPCTYHANSNSLMTMAIFESFLRMFDAKMSASATLYLRHVKVVFFPSNCTSYLHPLHQGIIRYVKQCYRKRLAYDRLASLEATKKISVLDAMNFLNSAWNSIDANTLSDSAVVEDTDGSITISKEWQQIAGTSATFSDYVDCDSSLFAFQQSLLKEILEQHQADANEEDNDGDDDDDDNKEQEALPIPTLTAALEAMDTVRRYVFSFNVDENVINQLSKMDTSTSANRSSQRDTCPSGSRTRPERWILAKKYRLCFRCLRQGHRSTDCKRSHNSRNVTSVGLHRLLSEDRNVRANEENCPPHGDERSEKSPETTPTDVSEPTNAVRVCANRTRDTRDRTYLQTAKAYLYAPNGNYTKVMCLFDTGSQRSFVTKGIADSLGLTGLSERVCISTLGNNTCHKKLRRVSFSLKGSTPNSQAKQINAYCVNRICDTLEKNPPVMWEHAKDLNLADDFPRDRCDVDVLIGIDYYYHFIEDDRRSVVDEWLVALRSTLGWILCGQDSRTNYTDTVKVMRIDVRPRCDCEKHRRFGELESIGIKDQPETESPAERRKQLSLKIDEIVCWSDSEVALSWIKSPAVKWKTFVRNRVESIQQLTEASVWRYCPTGENPADMLSRGCSLKRLEESQLWWEGPPWLSLPVENWPKKSIRVDQSKITSTAEARNKITTLAVSVIEKNDRLDPSRFSNFEKLVRVTAFCFRFFRNLQLPRHERKFAELTVEELAKAENFWLLTVQREAFEKELTAVQSGKNPEGKLARFNPYLDENGLLRVGGRLQNSDMDAERKHPILLPSTHPVVMLLIKRVHERSLHAGTEQTLTDLRQRFWVLKGRSSVKRIVRQCRICKRQCARPYEPIMNDLPIDRVTVAAPFERIGIDFAGPVYIKMRNNHVKTYICLFTCMVTRAIHLELVTSMTTKQFLNAFHRFAARRGYPVLVQSDNFKTFKQADQELRDLFSENQWSEIREALTVNRIKWKYITERAPWNGGYWERIVRSVKESLKKVLGNTRLEEDELRTVLCEIEARINSRPLTFVGDDPNDPNPLTPFHFLIGREFRNVHEIPHGEDNDPPYGAPTTKELSRRWKYRRTLVDNLWKRWKNEYVVNLSQRKKWTKSKQEPHVGDIVLVSEDEVPTHMWPMARVIEVYPGSDGVVRTVKVKTLKGTYNRSVRKLRLLEPAVDADGLRPSRGDIVVVIVATTCNRVVLDLPFLRRACRFLYCICDYK